MSKLVKENINDYLPAPDSNEILKRLKKEEDNPRKILRKSLMKSFPMGIEFALKNGAQFDKWLVHYTDKDEIKDDLKELIQKYKKEYNIFEDDDTKLHIGLNLNMPSLIKEVFKEGYIIKIPNKFKRAKKRTIKNVLKDLSEEEVHDLFRDIDVKLRFGIIFNISFLIEDALDYYKMNPFNIFYINPNSIPKQYISDFIEIYEDADKNTFTSFPFNKEESIFNLALRGKNIEKLKEYYPYISNALKSKLKGTKYENLEKYISSAGTMRRGFMTYHILRFIDENEPVRYTDIVKFIVTELKKEEWDREKRGFYSSWFMTYSRLFNKTDEGYYISEKGLDKLAELEKKVPNKLKRNVDYSVK